MTDETHRLDRFVSSLAALVAAFVWGLAEATFFFIVPDVLLTLLGSRALRPSLKASLAALAGALIGGAAMFALAMKAPTAARSFLDHVPAISPALIARVESQIGDQGLLAVMLGPIKGIPYKIYSVEWGARGGDFFGFLLISIPARYVRFFLSTIAARVIARGIERWTHHRASIEISILVVVWTAFYSFYFFKFGW